MTKNKKVIAAFLGLNLFLAVPTISLAKENNQFKNLFETNIGNDQKHVYNIRLYYNTSYLNEYNTNLLEKLFLYYLSSKVPGIEDETIKASFFLNQFSEKSKNSHSLFLKNNEVKKINKYYTKEKVKDLLEGNIENYNQLNKKVISLYDKNINEIKEYIKYLKNIKTNESYLKILEQVENRNREKINFLNNDEEELSEKEKIEKAKEIVGDEIKIADILIDQYEYEKKEIKSIPKEIFKKFLKDYQIEEFSEDKNAKMLQEKNAYDNYSNLNIRISLEGISINEIYENFLPPFFAKCLYDTLKNDTKNKVAQNFIKRNKEKYEEKNKKRKNKIYYINPTELINKYPMGLRAHMDYRNKQNILFVFESVKNVKEAKMIVDCINSKEFKENVKKNLKKENFEKHKNEAIKFIEKNRKYKNHKKQKNKSNSLEKEIENIKITTREKIRDYEERLKKEKNPRRIKSKKRSIKKAKEYLKNYEQIKEDAMCNLEDRKDTKDNTYKEAEKWINKLKNLSNKDFKKICKDYEITKAELKKY